jgi:hypothetical protein
MELKKYGLILFSVYAFAGANVDNSFRISYQNLKFKTDKTEKMGLFETSLLFKKSITDRLTGYLGPSIYSAVTGKRGGFFTGGLTGGILIPITKKTDLDIGIFAGGGGGTSAPDGDGLMFKTYAGVLYRYNKKFDG